MKKISLAALVSIALMGAPLVASAASVTIDSLSPGTSVMAKNRLSFNINASGFTNPVYLVTDSFSPTTVSLDDISPSGAFTWTPISTDVGTHVLTVKVNDYQGNSASVTQTITVLPPPSLSIIALTPGSAIAVGTKISFTALAQGFTNPSFSISDAFSGTSVTSADLDAQGNFSWTPDYSQNGQHTVTIYVYDSLGHSANVDVPIQVGAGATLMLQSIKGMNILPGQTASFLVAPNQFSPTNYTAFDDFPGTSLGNTNITSAGSFSWTPLPGDIGVHHVLVTGTVGVFGKSATTSQTIVVLNQNGTLPPGATAAPTVLTTTPTPTNTSTTASTPQSKHLFKVFLGVGSQGSEVMALQNLLTSLGFYKGPITGYFGALTKAAVMSFQSSKGISSVGYVGPATRAALNQ